MTSGLGNISLTGLLGGTAGKIDTDALVQALMYAKETPKRQLENKITQQQQITANYQGINSRLSTLTDAARKVVDTDSWQLTAATSSLGSVSASSVGTAATGSSTFRVLQTATTQVSTLTAGGEDGILLTGADENSTFTLTLGVGDAAVAHEIGGLGTGSATDIAAAVNKADIGVRAAVVNTDQGQVLQLTAKGTGAKNSFTVAGLDAPADTIVAAQDAKVGIGTFDPETGELEPGTGYTISSATNTFKDAMPGVTFTISGDAVGRDVTLTVADDTAKISAMVKAMVDAANNAKTGISQVTGKGGLLQGYSDVRTVGDDLSSTISYGGPGGVSYAEYGIDIDKNGVISFNSATFIAAYNADPSATMEAIADGLGTRLRQIAETASAPITGTLSQAITAANDRVIDMGRQIDVWNERLDKQEEQLRLKYIAMQTALSSLQAKGDWLNSMFESMDNSKKD